MVGAQFDEHKAPFHEARERGFVFHAPSFKAASAAMNDALARNHYPLIVEGENGIGKATSVLFWLRSQPEDSLTPAALEAEAVDADNVAGSLLGAFGLTADDGSSAEEALFDFVEDCAFAERPAVAAIFDAETLDDEVLKILGQLSKSPSQGGTGIALILTASAPLGWEEGETVVLEAMDAGTVKRFCEAATEASGLPSLGCSDEAMRALRQKSGGLMGRAGILFDQAYAVAFADGAAVIEPRHIPGYMPEAEAVPGVPSASDIEAALLALDPSALPPRVDEEEVGTKAPAEAEATTHKPVATPKDRPPQPRRRASAFPTIATGAGFQFGREAANDPARSRISPVLLEELTTLKNAIANLRDSVDHIRNEADALSEAISGRHDRIVQAAENVAETTREAIHTSPNGSTDG
jgi:hypothetical protein